MSQGESPAGPQRVLVPWPAQQLPSHGMMPAGPRAEVGHRCALLPTAVSQIMALENGFEAGVPISAHALILQETQVPSGSQDQLGPGYQSVSS